MKKQMLLAASAAALVTVLGFNGSALAGGSCGSGSAKETKAEAASTYDSGRASQTIVGVAVNAGTFQTLVSAIKATGLEATLNGKGPFTVFAPTDEAFAKLPKGTVEALLKDKEKLAQILTYHVVPGKVMAADVLKLKDATTVQGQKISISAGKEPMVNNSKIIATDVAANNGVIHVIDTVMLPQL